MPEKDWIFLFFNYQCNLNQEKYTMQDGKIYKTGMDFSLINIYFSDIIPL